MLGIFLCFDNRRCYMKDWEMYEEQIFEKFRSEFTDCIITKNYKVKGQHSLVKRQIDIAVHGKLVGEEVFVAVECKCFK